MKQYIVSDHAAKRGIDRLGMTPSTVKRELMTLMQRAEFQGVTEDGGRVFDHHNRRIRFIVAMDSNVITTVYNMRKPLADVSAKPLDESLPDTLLDAVKKQAAKLVSGQKRQLRKLELALAEAEVELAQKRLNRLKANNPRTKQAIDRDIAVIIGVIAENKAEVDAVQAHISQYATYA
ncbi:hypothetical protein MM326_13875 [Alkalihalobacillus sp. LMS6]|jgi:hypothetical protein|uniref:hypothetical protein n=1 Tax=Alkalihalobacillus sp. LMS6 TaxID=2924034 RepID=UPI0020D04BFC|nr:hypothetical protein [Alkalihalobacillus sp. LMS6]UTR05191.1 hypothetical protein MM326_13875 [Alkalihalobacillus sp. LMS6]